jgi:predicted NBD/HSP70 family sugar kinase
MSVWTIHLESDKGLRDVDRRHDRCRPAAGSAVTPPAGTVQGLRRSNRSRILRGLHRLGGSATRPDLVELSGLSAATVSLLVTELLDEGVLVAAPRAAVSRGRPPEELRFDPRFGVLVGIDVAETYVRAAAFDLALGGLAHWRAEQHRPLGGTELVDVCARAVDALRRQVAERPLLGVGVSVPGQVDPARGLALASPGRRTADVPLGPDLADHLRLPVVHVDNPLRASVMAELWLGAGRRFDDLAVLTLGTGVGAGLAVGGMLRRGAHQVAGEWGHVPVSHDGRRCPCGRDGCLEAYLGAPGLLRTLAEERAGTAGPAEHDESAAVAALAAAVDSGEPAARRAMERTAAVLADGLLLLAHLIDPDVVVVGGWVAATLGPRLLAPAERQARSRLLRPPVERWLLPSVLGADQVCTGAAALALEDVLERLASGRTGR